MNKTADQNSDYKKYICFLLAVFFLTLPLITQTTGLQNFNLIFTNEFNYHYNELSNKEHQFYNAFSVFSNYKKWSIGITLRANNFIKQDANSTFENIQGDIYKKFVRYSDSDREIHLGDFYSLLGNGLVLSVLKNDTILQDRSILGGKYKQISGKIDFRFLGGLVNSTTNFEEWWVIGGESHLQYSKNHNIGLHFSYIDDVDSYRELGKRLTYSISFFGSRFFNNFSYNIELASLSLLDGKTNGYGLFSKLSYIKDGFFALVEYKNYKDFNNELNNPPNADRMDEISLSQNTDGTRLYFQYTFSDPDLMVYVNYGRYQENDYRGDHIYGGFSLEDFLERVSLNVSYGIRDVYYPIKKTDLHLIYEIDDSWSVELSIKDKRYQDNFYTFKEIDHSIQLSFAPAFSLNLMHQFSYGKIIDLNHFFSMGFKYNFSSSSFIELSGGTIRGGEICSGGQCFRAPPFKGLKVSFFKIFN